MKKFANKELGCAQFLKSEKFANKELGQPSSLYPDFFHPGGTFLFMN